MAQPTCSEYGSATSVINTEFLNSVFQYFLSLAGNLGGLTWPRHSSRKSSATPFLHPKDWLTFYMVE